MLRRYLLTFLTFRAGSTITLLLCFSLHGKEEEEEEEEEYNNSNNNNKHVHFYVLFLQS